MLRQSLQIRLDKTWAGMNINLPQHRLSRIDKAVRRICRDNYDAARFYFARFVAHGDRGAAFNCESDLDIRMRMERRPLAWLGVHNVGRKWRTLLLADKVVGHSDKWQLLDRNKAHAR